MAYPLREPIGEDPLAFWRERASQLHDQLVAMTHRRDEAQSDLGKAEKTVREQELTITRLRRQLAEASSHG